MLIEYNPAPKHFHGKTVLTGPLWIGIPNVSVGDDMRQKIINASASGVKFIPGSINKVAKEDWDRIRTHKDVIGMLNKDILKVVQDGGDESDNELSEMKVQEAVQVVKNTFDRPLLEEWQESETRVKVVNAINSQLKKLIVTKDKTDEDEDAA